MTMKVVMGKPPNWSELVKAFPVGGLRGVLVTYGDAIYVPNGGKVSPQLHAHEGAHAYRQVHGDFGGPDGWWALYMRDPEFRLREELIGYRAQLESHRSWGFGRKAIEGYAKSLARHLSGPIYGNLISESKALKQILAS